MAVQYVGVKAVAAWFDVNPATVTHWRKTFTNTPEPDAYLNDWPGWLPSRESDWRAWHRSPSGPRPYRRRGWRR